TNDLWTSHDPDGSVLDLSSASASYDPLADRLVYSWTGGMYGTPGVLPSPPTGLLLLHELPPVALIATLNRAQAVLGRIELAWDVTIDRPPSNLVSVEVTGSDAVLRTVGAIDPTLPNPI